ncbi:MAG: hypothetical protein KAR39_12150 [Thermoplasmata archaeon]|nr:hypothetical protein [Thermoplasmata archaeon]
MQISLLGSAKAEGEEEQNKKGKEGVRGLKSTESRIPRGFVIHHNFLRPHRSLEGKAPAEVAQNELPFEDGWGDLIRWSTTFEARKRWDDGVEGLEIELVAT